MDKLYIIKIGGNIIDDEDKLASFLMSFAEIKGNKILVHGGGKMATKLQVQLGIQPTLVDGRRITDAETLQVVTMVYAGYINKNIVAKLQALNCNAMGLSGADGNIIRAHKRINSSIDYGFAGDIDEINKEALITFLQHAYCPVFSAITHDKKGQLLNTNADTIANELALALASMYDTTLVYGFEKAGVLTDINNEDSIISTLGKSQYMQLKQNNQVFSGMIPKLDNAFMSIEKGVSKVIIGNAENLQHLITKGEGTHIINE